MNLDGGVDPRGYHLTEATTFDTKGATNSTAFHGAGVVVGVDKWQTPLIRFFLGIFVNWKNVAELSCWDLLLGIDIIILFQENLLFLPIVVEVEKYPYVQEN